MSDRLILAIAASVGIFICVISWLANSALLACGYPAAMSLVKCDAAGGIITIVLIWRLLRWSRERNQLIRERVKIVTELNHEVRNAIQVISLADFCNGGDTENEVRASILRIERALDEYVPNQSAHLIRFSAAKRAS
ncbi:MAG: hypothetical protein ACR2IF_04210 [Terriglobales bacterium]